jgi:hypothetical protein
MRPESQPTDGTDRSPAIATTHWPALERLREIFLSGQPVRGSYWTCREDLEAYDATLGERIGWKWDAVLGELGRLGWSPPVGPLVDFGCGSGVASRRVLDRWSMDRFPEIRLIDKSPLATGFAASRLRGMAPGVRVVEAGSSDVETVMAGATVLLSHVLGEMLPAARRQLSSALAGAAAVIWVEPGTHADSRALIAMREELLGAFSPVAPCVHGGRCGLLEAGQDRHWCHFFANPPVGVLADPDWAAFAAHMGIDLRSVPYSYLVLQRGQQPVLETGDPGEPSRVLGTPRIYKGFSRLFCCAEAGVEELELPRRLDEALYKAIKREEAGSLFRLRSEAGRIQSIEPLPSTPV